MGSLLQDIRYACRMLRAQPGWTLAAVLCLAIGTGANTAVLSFINAFVLRPLPFAEPRQLVMVAVLPPDRAQTRPFSLAEYRELRPQADAVVQVSARTFAPVALAAAGEARMVESEFVSGNYFDMLRVAPLAGRLFGQEVDDGGGSCDAVISHGLWQRRFGADPSIVGRVVRVNAHPVTVCGIAPPGFVGATLLVAADLWLPARLYRPIVARGAADSERTPMFGVIGRLRPGIMREQARGRIDVIVATIARDPRAARPPAAVVDPAAGFGVPPAVRKTAMRASALLFGLIALFTAVAVANVASLMLARAAGRQREMGVRLALGAPRWRVVRQMLVESLVLSLIGAAAGMMLAVWVLRALGGLGQRLPNYISFAMDPTPDARVFAYAAIVAVVFAILFGLAPARFAARTNLVDVLKGPGGSGRAPAAARALTTIVVGQMAISTVLLVGAGLLVRTYLNALAIDPGIRTHNLLAVSLDLDQLQLDEDAGRRFYEELRTRAAAIPAVETASLTREAPLAPGGRDAVVWAEDANTGAGTAPHEAGATVVTPEHFAALGISVIEGRVFTPLDRAGARVAVVNETMARRFWPAGSALGRRFRLRDRSSPPIEVVGVVKDVKYRSLTEAPRPVVYQPLAQAYSAQMTLLVRSSADARAIAGAVERAVRDGSRDLAVLDIRTLDEQLDAAVATRRNAALVLLVLCLLGLLSSSVGLYGVVLYGVRQRAREIGIRMAIGARARDVLLMILGQGLRLSAIGLAIGIGLSLAVTRLIESLLYGVEARDPLTLAVVSGVLLVVALAAAYVPARRATAVDPMLTLRAE